MESETVKTRVMDGMVPITTILNYSCELSKAETKLLMYVAETVLKLNGLSEIIADKCSIIIEWGVVSNSPRVKNIHGRIGDTIFYQILFDSYIKYKMEQDKKTIDDINHIIWTLTIFFSQYCRLKKNKIRDIDIEVKNFVDECGYEKKIPKPLNSLLRKIGNESKENKNVKFHMYRQYRKNIMYISEIKNEIYELDSLCFGIRIKTKDKYYILACKTRVKKNGQYYDSINSVKDMNDKTESYKVMDEHDYEELTNILS